MIKKMFFIAMIFFGTLQAEDIDQVSIDLAFKELIYNVGLSLACQDLIIDYSTAKNAVLCACQEVEELTQVAHIFLIMDEEFVDLDITTVDELIDYEIYTHNDMAQACAIWLSAYQKLFIIFIAMHLNDVSFATWCNDVAFIQSLQDDQEIDDPAYELLWQASYDVMEAQINFSNALRNIE